MMRFFASTLLSVFFAFAVMAQENVYSHLKVVHISFPDSGDVYDFTEGREIYVTTGVVVKLFNTNKYAICSYPAVQALTNKKGDTLALGSPQYYCHPGELNQDYSLMAKPFKTQEGDTLLVHVGSMNETATTLQYVIPNTVKNKPYSAVCTVYMWAYIKRGSQYMHHKNSSELSVSMFVNAFGGRELIRIYLEPATVVDAGTNNTILNDSIFRLRCESQFFQNERLTQFELHIEQINTEKKVVVKDTWPQNECDANGKNSSAPHIVIVDLDEGVAWNAIAGGNDHSGGYIARGSDLIYSPTRSMPDANGTIGNEKKGSRRRRK
jgi:hypothetical protein